MNIHRIDNEESRTHSWHVVIQRNSAKYTKHFSDNANGGKQQALEKALKWRDKTRLKRPALSKRDYISIRRKNNKSGVVGVCFSEGIETLKSGKITTRPCWIASWATAPRKSKSIRFSVSRHGHDVAFAKACDARALAVDRVEGDFYPTKLMD